MKLLTAKYLIWFFTIGVYSSNGNCWLLANTSSSITCKTFQFRNNFIQNLWSICLLKNVFLLKISLQTWAFTIQGFLAITEICFACAARRDNETLSIKDDSLPEIRHFLTMIFAVYHPLFWVNNYSIHQTKMWYT